MKIAKRIGLAISIVVTLIFIIAAFSPKEYQVVRTIEVNRSTHDVFEYLKLVKNQKNYSKRALLDPHMETSFFGIDGTTGFVYEWESTNPQVGKGKQEIVAIIPSQRIDYKVYFVQPILSEANSWIETDSISPNRTKITWGIQGKLDYPSNILLWIYDMETELSNEFDLGLANLNNLLAH
jgi:hypothetical protein